MTTRAARVSHIGAATCLPRCHFRGSSPRHHDRLVRVTRDHAELLDLLELALTWHELDYTPYGLIEPWRWEGFLASHRWHDHEHARRVFHLAQDIAMRSSRGHHPGDTAESVFSALTGQCDADDTISSPRRPERAGRVPLLGVAERDPQCTGR